MGFFKLLGMNVEKRYIKNGRNGKFKELVCFNKETDESELLKINEEDLPDLYS